MVCPIVVGLSDVDVVMVVAGFVVDWNESVEVMTVPALVVTIVVWLLSAVMVSLIVVDDIPVDTNVDVCAMYESVVVSV